MKADCIRQLGITYYHDPLSQWRVTERMRFVGNSSGEPLVGELNTKKVLGISATPKSITCRAVTYEFEDHCVRVIVPEMFEWGASEFARIFDIVSRTPASLLQFGRAVLVLPPGQPYFSPDTDAGYRPGGLITIDSESILDRGLYLHEFAHGFLTDTPLPYQKALTELVRAVIAIDGTCGPTEYAATNDEEALCVGFQYFDEAGDAMQQLVLNLIAEEKWRPRIERRFLGKLLKKPRGRF